MDEFHGAVADARQEIGEGAVWWRRRRASKRIALQRFEQWRVTRRKTEGAHPRAGFLKPSFGAQQQPCTCGVQTVNAGRVELDLSATRVEGAQCTVQRGGLVGHPVAAKDKTQQVLAPLRTVPGVRVRSRSVAQLCPPSRRNSTRGTFLEARTSTRPRLYMLVSCRSIQSKSGG